MEKKKKRLLCLLLILPLLLVILFLMKNHNQKQEEKQEAEEEAARIYATDISEVGSVSYKTESGEFTFEKKKDTWIYQQDPDFPLAQTYPEQIVSSFGKLEALRELKDGDDLEAYGLDTPAYTVKLTDMDGKETELSIGNAVDEAYYLLNKTTEKIYTVSSSVIGTLQHTLEEMAQLDDYPNIGSGNLKKEVITRGGETTTYDSENEDDAKNIAAVAGGLGAVTLSSAADYSVEDKDLKGFGLDEASRTTVEATYTKDEEEQALTLYIGSEDGEGNRYVMLNDSRIVYLISVDVCDNILNVEDSAETE